MKKEKMCPQCEQFLPATTENFYNDKSKKGGLSSSCKTCKKASKKKKETAPAKLTALEEKLMREMPLDNFYENELDSILWTDGFLDGFSEGSKVGRGVISSLVKKGYISVSDADAGRAGNPTSMRFTELGKSWMEDEPKPEETKKEETPAPTPQPEPETETEQEDSEEVETDKKCSKCGTYLPATAEYFYRDKNRKDGMDSWCKTCTKEYHKSKRQATKTAADETPKAE